MDNFPAGVCLARRELMRKLTERRADNCNYRGMRLALSSRTLTRVCESIESL